MVARLATCVVVVGIIVAALVGQSQASLRRENAELQTELAHRSGYVVASCQEDETLVGTGDFSNGQWSAYECGPAVDDYMATEAQKVLVHDGLVLVSHNQDGTFYLTPVTNNGQNACFRVGRWLNEVNADPKVNADGRHLAYEALHEACGTP